MRVKIVCKGIVEKDSGIKELGGDYKGERWGQGKCW